MRELYQALKLAVEVSRSRREERYEGSRLEAIDDKLDADERLLREMRQAKEQIARLEKELKGDATLDSLLQMASGVVEGSGHSTGDQTENVLKHQLENEATQKRMREEKKAQIQVGIQNDLRQQQKLLAWAKFQETLSDAVASYDLASQRHRHPLHATDNAGELVDRLLDMFDRDILTGKHQTKSSFLTAQDRQWLAAYIRESDRKTVTTTILPKIKELLTAMVGQPEWLMADPTCWKVHGRSLVLSEILIRFNTSSCSSCEEIQVRAEDVLFIDQDWQVAGLSLNLSSAGINHLYQIQLNQIESNQN